MINTRVREATDARDATGSDASPAEPSHIHIPRPSRVSQPAVTVPEDSGDLAVDVAEAA